MSRMVGHGEAEEEVMSFLDKASDVLWFEATHEMKSFNSLVAKLVSGILIIE